MPTKLTYEQLMKLLEQFPTDEGDVFNMGFGHEEPANNFAYTNHIEPSREKTITVSLLKSLYPNIHAARKRAAELFATRHLVPYKKFETARCYCWYTQKLEDYQG